MQESEDQSRQQEATEPLLYGQNNGYHYQLDDNSNQVNQKIQHITKQSDFDDSVNVRFMQPQITDGNEEHLLVSTNHLNQGIPENYDQERNQITQEPRISPIIGTNKVGHSTDDDPKKNLLDAHSSHDDGEEIIKEEKPGQAQPEIEKQPQVVNPTKKLMKYMSKEIHMFIWATIALVGGNMGQLVVPYYVGLFVDAITNKNYNKVYELTWQLVLIVFVSSVCVFVRGMFYNVISERIARNLRGDLYESLINKDVEFFDSKKTGDLLSRIGSDTAVIQEGLSTNVSMFLRSLIFIIVAFVFLFLISWELTLVMIGSILPVIIFSVYYGKMMKVAQKKIQDSKALISTVAEETFSNVRTVKAFATELDETARYNKGNNEVYDIGYTKAVWYGVFNFVANFFVFGSMAAILVLGAKLCEDNKLTVGEITAFLFYMMQILLNFMILASVLGSVMSIIGASYKIVELLEYKPKINTTGGEVPKFENEKDFKGEISLRGVKFNYPTKKEVEVLKGVNIDISQNRVVALVGPSGCGKSSIISMIERFYDPREGQVLFDGRDVKGLNPRWYHRQIAIVSQEPVLFSGTIKENITYGCEAQQWDESILDEACRMANAYDFIHDKDLFPEGYNTIVGERGVKLSGGQKQRIAIARALIRKPKVLLLDEATSALDAESEHQVQKALDKLIKSGQQTVIVIAHRLSTIRDADEIIVIKKGEIAERGSHEELIKNGTGVYKQLVERQLMSVQLDDQSAKQ